MSGGKEIRAGVIGLGVGERHIAGYEASGRCEVVTLCDIDPVRLSEVASRHPGCRVTSTADDILRDPSIGVVSIASYDDAHAAQVIAAIEAGKHVFVEKPLCLTRGELSAIAAAAARRPTVRLSSNLILRMVPRFTELRRRIRGGEFGRTYYLEGDYDYGRVHKITEGWRSRIPEYSVVHGGAIHLIDLLLWLTGGRVEEVFAYGNRIATEGTPFRRSDLVAALLRFRDGCIAKVTANFASVTPHLHKLSAYGTAQTFEQSHTGAAYFRTRDPAVAPELVTDAYPGVAKGDMLGSFIRHVLDGTAPDVTMRQVFDTMAVSLAIEESLESGRPVIVKYGEGDFGE